MIVILLFVRIVYMKTFRDNYNKMPLLDAYSAINSGKYNWEVNANSHNKKSKIINSTNKTSKIINSHNKKSKILNNTNKT